MESGSDSPVLTGEGGPASSCRAAADRYTVRSTPPTTGVPQGWCGGCHGGCMKAIMVVEGDTVGCMVFIMVVEGVMVSMVSIMVVCVWGVCPL